MTSSLFQNRMTPSAEDEGWPSIADMMAGLAIVFMFIAIIYIRPVIEQRETIRELVVAFDEAETSIYDALVEEFTDDLPIWDAEIDKTTLSVRFRSPEVLFSQGEAGLRSEFKSILDDFFPRYLEVLDGFKGRIDEVRIEGHTSSDWNELTTSIEAYFLNMELSQARTRSVLEYGLSVDGVTGRYPWAIGKMTANGLSSSRTIIVDGLENSDASRRVEFKIRTDAKTQMVKVLEEVR